MDHLSTILMHHLFFRQLVYKVDQQVKSDQELPATFANNSDPFLLFGCDAMAVGYHISIILFFKSLLLLVNRILRYL